MAMDVSRMAGFFSFPMAFAGEPEEASTREDMTPGDSVDTWGERSPEDANLVRRMAGGDKQACADLYDRFSRPLYSVALRILNDSSEAQDIIQDVFLTLWEKANEFDESRGSAFGWAVTLVRNRSIDRLRTRRRRGTLLSESFAEDIPGASMSSAVDSVDELIFKEKSVAVRSALSTLPKEQSHALELAFFSGLTQQEIAGRLNEPLGTVKARIRRGLLKLRDSLTRRHD